MRAARFHPMLCCQTDRGRGKKAAINELLGLRTHQSANLPSDEVCCIADQCMLPALGPFVAILCSVWPLNSSRCRISKATMLQGPQPKGRGVADWATLSAWSMHAYSGHFSDWGRLLLNLGPP